MGKRKGSRKAASRRRGGRSRKTLRLLDLPLLNLLKTNRRSRGRGRRRKGKGKSRRRRKRGGN